MTASASRSNTGSSWVSVSPAPALPAVSISSQSAPRTMAPTVRAEDFSRCACSMVAAISPTLHAALSNSALLPALSWKLCNRSRMTAGSLPTRSSSTPTSTAAAVDPSSAASCGGSTGCGSGRNSSSSALRRSDNWRGLVKYWSMPTARQRSDSPLSAVAVSAAIGTCRLPCSCARIAAVSS